MKTKIRVCCVCNEETEVNFMHRAKLCYCLKCRSEKNKELNKKYESKPERKEYQRKYKQNEMSLHPEKVKLRRKKYMATEHAKKLKRIQDRKYYRANKTKIFEHLKNRYSEDVQLRMSRKIRNNINQSLNRFFKTRYQSKIPHLGCNVVELIAHLESKFEKGMNWGNKGEWHIDHIKPLSKFNLTDINDLKEVCHYSNIQPLWAIDNLKKGAN